MENSNKLWLLFDGRFRTDEDSAICFEVCDTLEEAKTNCNDYGDDTVIVEAEELRNEIKYLNIINK